MSLVVYCRMYIVLYTHHNHNHYLVSIVVVIGQDHQHRIVYMPQQINPAHTDDSKQMTDDIGQQTQMLFTDIHYPERMQEGGGR